MPLDAHVTFGLGEALFALPVAFVQEILDVRPPAPLPGGPPHLLGVIDVRGLAVPVADLRRLLGEPDRPDGPDTRFVVLLLDPAARPVALRVDRVIEVAALDGLEPAGDGGALAPDPALVEGIGRRGGAFVAVLRARGLVGRAGAAA